MEHDFWHNRWEEGRIGFHQAEINEQLQRYWPDLTQEAKSRETGVLVPLCGKSSDMLWLREQGHAVLGVELNRSACEAFFSENGAEAQVSEESVYIRYACEGIDLLCGDIFALSAEQLSGISFVYDRAALVALPTPMRRQYAELLKALLPAGAQILLIAMEFEGDQGPPFAVREAEIRELFEARFDVERLELEGEDDLSRRDVAYRLTDKE